MLKGCISSGDITYCCCTFCGISELNKQCSFDHGFFIFNGFVNWTIIFAPLVFLPLIILSLGLTWLISSLGVYIRDIGQSIGVIVTVLIFLSPVFTLFLRYLLECNILYFLIR